MEGDSVAAEPSKPSCVKPMLTTLRDVAGATPAQSTAPSNNITE